MNSKRLDSEGGERLFIICSILLTIISVTPIQASATSALGIVRVAPPFSICMQGDTHYLEDPCDGSLVTRLSSDTIDLNWYLDQYVEVEGTEIGVECSIINVQNIDILPAPLCPAPGCSSWTNVIDKYNAYVSGSASWDDVIACYTQYAS
jgi:hypothetical protein